MADAPPQQILDAEVQGPRRLRQALVDQGPNDGERVQLVEVVNATAEPDGSYRRYLLRVPPTACTARQAVGWTFGFDNANDYIVASAS
jgi:hypothetical protein